MDTELLQQMYAAETAGSEKFTRRMAINIADFFAMSPMSLVWQLEKRGIARAGAWDWFRSNGGITDEQVQQVRSERTTRDAQSA